MGAVQNVIDRLRGAFIADKERGGQLLAKGSTSPTYPDSGYDLLQAYGYDALSDYLRLEHDLLCLSGDTRVLVLNDGVEWVPIRELAEKYKHTPKDAIYTLSFDRSTQRVVCSQAFNPRRTKREQVYYVVMVGSPKDRNHSYVVKATANHPFLMRDGKSYKRVDELEPGDSVMPAGVSLKSSVVGDYWYVFQPFELTRTGAHSKQVKLASLIAECVLGRRLVASEAVHHKNCDKSCDALWNLEVKSRGKHHRDHTQELWRDAEWARKTAKAIRERKSQDDPKTIEKRKLGTGPVRIEIAEEDLKDAVRNSSSINEVARHFGVNWWTIRSRMDRHNISTEMLGTKLNHRVVAILPAGVEDVYDLTVPEFENFAAEGVIVHNSRYVDYEEMDDEPSMASSLDIYADDASQPDTQLQRTVWVSSQDKTLQGVLDDLFHKRLRLDEEIWEITRSLVKYGNNYEELLINQDGVVGLNFLPAPTVRRVEGPRGELYGFVQDFKGRFGFSPQEFQKILAQRTDAIRQAMQPGQARVPGNILQRVNALEPWEVAHFRLRSKHRRSVYGYCLRGASRVWTPEGLKAIQDVRSGDRVYTRHAGRLLTTKVLDQVCSGVSSVYRLRTKHREIVLTEAHPVLVDRGGKNNAWVPAGEVRKGEKIIIAAKMPEMHAPPALGIRLSELREDAHVRLTARGRDALRFYVRRGRYAPRDEGLGVSAALLGISKGQLEGLFEGRPSLTFSEAREFFHTVGLPFFDGAVEVVSEDGRLQLPDFMEPWFVRLWGFLLGDGWITEGQVCFARKVYEDRNQLYQGMFERMGLKVGRTRSEEGVEHQAYVSSKALVQLFTELGWVNGAHHKRVPSWVFGLSEEYRKEFLEGFADADGWSTHEGQSLHTELCNEALVRDLKNLIDGLGWKSGRVRERGPRTSVLKSGKEIKAGPQYTLTYYDSLLADGDEFTSEEVLEFDFVGEEPVYDIQVANREHNFIAEGVVVHNSVLEPARWIWKRLMLLEDAAMIYRLQRAPERFAFYVDVGDLPPAEALAFVNKVRQQHKKKRYVNSSTGKLDLKFETLSQDDDFWVPVRKGVEGTRIEVLGGPAWQHMDDVSYFQTKLFTALKVPKAYLAQDENTARAVLSSEDVRFARSVLRVQREVRNGLRKVARTHLAALNIDPYANEYSVHMTVPSAIFELAQLEVRNARADLASRMKEHVSLRWVLENVYLLSDEDIKIIIQERSEDVIREGKAQAEVEKMSAQAQAEVEQASAAAGGGMESLASSSGMKLLERKLNALPRRIRSAITERELQRGNREAEKRAEGKLNDILRSNDALARRLKESTALLRDVVTAAHGH